VSFPIELVPLGKTSIEPLEYVCKRLNEIQHEFDFNLPPVRLREEGVVFSRSEYLASEVFAWLQNYRTVAKGNRPYLIGFIDGPLRSAKLSNLFGSHEAENGVAVVTLDDHKKYVSSTHAYVAYYLVRYAISFVAPAVKTHDDDARRWCFFDRKLNKYHIRQSLIEGRFCDDCMRQLQSHFTAEIIRSIEAMATLVKDLELHRDESVAKPNPPSVNAPADDSTGALRQPGSVPVGYAVLSVIAFIAAVVLALVLRRSDSALANNLLYFATVIALAAASAITLFGVLNSYAKYSGKVLGGLLELGGPAVIFFVVLLLAYKLKPHETQTPPPAPPFNVTVHARDANNHPVTQGALLLTVGQETKEATLNARGEGTFKEIGPEHRGAKLPLEERVDDFALKEPKRLYEIVPSVLTVELEEDFDPLNAKVTLDAGTTNLVTLVTRLGELAGGVMLDPEVAAKLKKRKVTFGQPLRDVRLRVALERIFAQAQTSVVFEKQGSITWIRQAKP
jgi:hypothetical protein